MMPKDSEENLNNEAEPEPAEPEGAESPESLEQALAEAQQKAEEYLASWQRAQADFANYKRRTEEERQDFSRYANAQLILSMLPVLDDLERALDAGLPADADQQGWLEGIRMVERKFRTILEGQGIKPIQAVGEPFDPNLHEALRQAEGEEGIVVEEFQKGYMMNDRVLRPAQVVVGNGEEAKEDLNNG
jgi:molecular chaperone GrpE